MLKKKVLVIGPMLADISLNIKLPHTLNSIIAHSNISISPGGKGV